MFKEVIEKEDEQREFDERVHKYGDMTIVSLESVKNATVLARIDFYRYQRCINGRLLSLLQYLL